MRAVILFALGLAMAQAATVDLELPYQVEEEQVERGGLRGGWMEEEEEERVVWGKEEEEENAVDDDDASLRATCPDSGQRCHEAEGVCQASSLSTYKCEIRGYNYCNSSSCTCCIDCQANYSTSECYKASGIRYCYRLGYCPSSYYVDPFYPCTSRSCQCCRYCYTTKSCYDYQKHRYIGYGFCSNDEAYLYAYNPYVYRDYYASCSPYSQCNCYRYCMADKDCSALNGYCIRDTECCGTGYCKFNCGCTSRKCACCVPGPSLQQARTCLACKPENDTMETMTD